MMNKNGDGLKKIDLVDNEPDFAINGNGQEGVGVDTKRRKFAFLSKLRPGRKGRKVLLGGGGVFLLILLLSIYFLILPVVSLYRQSSVLMDSGKGLVASIDTQNINEVEARLQDFKGKLLEFQKTYKRLSWIGVMPFFGDYWHDGNHGINAGIYGIEAGEILIMTARPYADIVGFGGGGVDSANAEETANDRIDFLVRTIEDILPQVDVLAEKAGQAQNEIQQIDPERYPEEFRGMRVKSRLREGFDLVDLAANFLKDSKPLLERTPYLIGADSPRRYLLLFQNDKELRPTGGFLTAYSIVEVRAGKFLPTTTDDIYNLDGNYNANIDAPEPILQFIREPYSRFPELRLRDMNWSPDFATSMELFLEEARSVGIDDIDGVIAVDTHVAVNLLQAIGQIGVSGFGNFSSENDPRCDCPQVVYELEAFADVEGAIVWSQDEPGKIIFAPPNYLNRKKIVGPLMNSILANSLSLPAARMPLLAEAVWKTVVEKHVLMYVFDEKAQEGLESFGLAGRIKEFSQDYLHVNDSNLGGRKSNLYVKHQVEQDIAISDSGEIVKTVTLTYNNPQDQDGWLNSVLPNWTRVYVPKGSELIDSEGFDEDVVIETDLGKTVFAGGFELRPKGIKKITLTYKLPFKQDSDEYMLMVQKQPGKDAPLYSIKIKNQMQEMFLKTDKLFKFRI